MKFNQLGFALGFILLAGQGCGKNDPPAPSAGTSSPAAKTAPQSYDEDKAAFLAAFDLYNRVGADDSKNFTQDEKIAACSAYIAQAQNMIAKYSNREDQPG